MKLSREQIGKIIKVYFTEPVKDGQSLENIMERRENYVCCVDSERMKPVEGLDKEAAVAFPIVGGGDVSGAIVMLLNENGSCPTQTETKLAQIAANFLGKQMEE